MWSVYLQLCVSLIIGIYLGKSVSAGDAIIFMLALILSSLFRKIVLKKFFSMRVFVVFIAAVGIILYNHAISDRVRSAYPFNDKCVTMLGKITDLPKTVGDNNVYIVDVKLINYLDKNHDVNERIRVTSHENFDFGDSVRIKGFLNTFPKALNGGDFNSARYYKAKGIYFKMYADQIQLCKTKFKNYSPFYFFTWLKSLISNEIYKYYDGDRAAILRAVLTGYKDGFSDEFKSELYQANMMRLFYPAYIHISLIIMIVGLFSTVISRKKRDIILIVMLVLYAVANFNTHYIAKSALLAAVLVLSKHKMGFANYMDMMSIIVFALLITNPLIEFEPGFVLSVSANVLIFYFVPPVSKKLFKIHDRKKRKFAALWIVTSIGLLPLQAYYFNTITPYAFLLNVLYTPILSLIFAVMPINAILTSLVGKINPAEWIIEGLLFYMRKIPGAVSKLPGYSIPLPSPGILIIAICYLGLYIIRQSYLLKRKDKFSVNIAVAIMAAFITVEVWGFVQTVNDLQINFVNVGQGDGAVLSIPFRETLIIDGGGNNEFSSYDYGEEIFVPYLKRNGHSTIDLAIVSHYHSDHCKGVIAAMKKLNVREVLMPDCMEDNAYRKEMEMLAENKSIKLSYYKAGAVLKYKSGLVLDIISPDDTDLLSEDENDTSFGIRVSYGDFSALFTGDMSANVEKHHRGEWGRSSVLKVGHHGSRTASSEEFLNEVFPQAAIISVGENNMYTLPHDEVLNRYQKRSIPVYRTDLLGDIIIFADKKGGFKLSSSLEE